MTPEEFASTNAGVGVLRHELRRHLQQIELLAVKIAGAEGTISRIEQDIVSERRRVIQHQKAVADIRTVLASLGVLESIEDT